MMQLYPRRREFLAVLSAGFFCRRVPAAQSGWLTLFDGRTLNGWRAEGKADWRVEDGAIVGRQGPGEAPGDLFTVGQWADFELQLDWKMRWPGNSGIWFRYSGRGKAYQADFLDQASQPGILSGSLYCPGKKFIAENRDPATVHKDGWNSLRIRAVGDRIVIEQNGKKVVDVRDNTIPGPGSIGIQVHPGKKFAGMEVRVRNVRLLPL